MLNMVCHGFAQLELEIRTRIRRLAGRNESALQRAAFALPSQLGIVACVLGCELSENR
jgi:hypothetical protein